MAIINKTGISAGGTIEAEHITRVIDALSGVSTDTVVATGSFSGSFNGSLNGSITSASFATSASRATSASLATSATRATSASFAIVAQQIDVTATKVPADPIDFNPPTIPGYYAPNYFTYTTTQPVGIVSLDFAHVINAVVTEPGGTFTEATSTGAITGSLRVKVFPNGDTGSAYYFTFSVPVTASLSSDAWIGNAGS